LAGEVSVGVCGAAMIVLKLLGDDQLLRPPVFFARTCQKYVVLFERPDMTFEVSVSVKVESRM
jgi:hypothetical protein